jgi:hypothetical protein
MSTLSVSKIKNSSSTIDNITLNSDGTNSLGVLGSFNRNRLINGSMAVYQRGSVSATTSGAYTLDRWFVTPTGATVTVTQSTSTVPTGFANSLNVSGAASVTNVSVYQRIESVNTQDLASGVQVTVSGWIRQSTGSAVTTATIALTTPSAADNYASTSSAATTYTIPSIANATWVQFSNTFTLTASCVNGLQVTIAIGAGLTTGSLNLTGVQLEVGSVATPFERRQYGQELALCQRYCYVVKGSGTYGAMTTGGYVTNAGTSARAVLPYPVIMRTSPTVTFSAAATFLVQGSSNYTVTAIALGGSGSTPFSAVVDATISGATSGDALIILDNNSSTAQITSSSEL